LDEDGNKIGIPGQTTSLFPPKAHAEFPEQNLIKTFPFKIWKFKKRIKIAIDWTLHGKTHNLGVLEKRSSKGSGY